MMEQTNTLWVFFVTKKKNLLTKISDLKQFGKMKVDDMKVVYGQSHSGKWSFQLKGEPASNVYSFHDGEVVLRNGKKYETLRSSSGLLYCLLISTLWICLSWPTWTGFFGNKSELRQLVKKQTPVAKAKTPVVIKKKAIVPSAKPKKTFSVHITDPKSRNALTDARHLFQMGEFGKMTKVLKPHLKNFSVEDRKIADHLFSQMFFVQCRKYFKLREERKAVIHCEKSTQYDSNEKASEFLRLQDEKAKSMYLEGYTMLSADSATARKRFRNVLQVAKSDSTWRNKAEYQLRKIKK